MPTASKKKRRSSPQAGDDDVVEETSNENFENRDELRRNSRDKRPKFDDAEEYDEMEEAPPSPMQNPDSNHHDVNSPIRDRHTNPTGKPAEAGIIHEVYVENFMCHRKLTVQLCRNVNFIHGQNGRVNRPFWRPYKCVSAPTPRGRTERETSKTWCGKRPEWDAQGPNCE